MDAPAAAPMASPAPQPGGFVVEIYVMADGAMSVKSKPMEQEMGEEGAAAGGGTPAKGVGEALKLALQLIQAGGSSGDDEFAKGFASAGASEETVEMTPDTSMGAR